MKLPINAEPLVGLLRHFVGRETTFSTVWKCKSLSFFLLKKLENFFFVFKLNETGTSLYFLTVEKVAVSLPTKCLSNPTSGSALIGDEQVFSRRYFQRGDINSS